MPLKAFKIGAHLIVGRVLEDLLELNNLGYPPTYLKTVVFMLPLDSIALALRRIVLCWLASLKPSTMTYGKSRAYPTPAKKDRDGGRKSRRDHSGGKREKKRKHSRRRSSSSSSTSTSSNDKKVRKAEKVLAKRDPRYSKWLKDEEENEEKEKMEKQGALLAKAIKDTLGDAWSPPVKLSSSSSAHQSFPPQPAEVAFPPPMTTGTYSDMQMMVIRAELQHQVDLPMAGKDAVKTQIRQAMANRSVVKAVELSLYRSDEGAQIPRNLNERVDRFLSSLFPTA